jgi:hypothetical protein
LGSDRVEQLLRRVLVGRKDQLGAILRADLAVLFGQQKL